jgi:hypothetical protein
MITAVFDTNVLASGSVAGEKTAIGILLDHWQQDAFLLFVSEPLIVELERTLHNDYFSNRELC